MALAVGQSHGYFNPLTTDTITINMEVPDVTDNEKLALRIRYAPMALALARRFAKRFGRVYFDMEEEAVWTLDHVLARWELDYKPRKSAPGTWIYRNIYHALLNACTRAPRPHVPFSAFETSEGEGFDRPAKMSRVLAVLRDLGTDARLVAETVLYAPSELLDDVTATAKRRTRQAVTQYLAKRHGWAPQRVARAWVEVETCLIA